MTTSILRLTGIFTEKASKTTKPHPVRLLISRTGVHGTGPIRARSPSSARPGRPVDRVEDLHQVEQLEDHGALAVVGPIADGGASRVFFATGPHCPHFVAYPTTGETRDDFRQDSGRP